MRWRRGKGEAERRDDAVATPRSRSACFAPGSSLYLRPDGMVMTCCAGWHALGQVHGPERQSLREIWQGERRAQLRAALADGDFGLGCFSCKIDLDDSGGTQTLARDFDRYGEDDRDFPATIDFALSDRCNLQCVQCSGTFSSSIRRHREHREPLTPAYDDRFFEELDEFLPHLERAQFKGGEPFLGREHRRIWDRLIELDLHPEIAVTTNGTIWNEKVERYTRELGFHVIVSIDAVDPEQLEAIRVGASAERLWENIERFRAICAETGATLTLTLCLMSINWDQLAPFLQACDRLGANPHIEWVGGPGHFSLLSLPHPDLEEVRAGFDAAAPGLADLSPASRSIWDDAVYRVGGVLAAGDRPGQPVAIGVNPEVAHARRIQEAADELGATDPAAILRLDFVDEVLATVQAPPWSAPLQAEGWVGIGMRETITAIGGAADGPMNTQVEAVEGGAHRITITMGLGGRPTVLRGFSLPHPQVSGTMCLLLVEAARAFGAG